ncbi:MAG: DNA polymerase II large subunit [Candidatus Lokiarchaeota archaeon]|nr:DNA polymerase II large subunit [Candidatus Harpocratesius repetitus]
MPVVMSDKYRKYFDQIERDVEKIYQVAQEARKIGVDPVPKVESPRARDMAGRVEKLVGPPGIADLLRQWKEEGADQDELCFRSMDWLIDGKLGDFSQEEKVDRSIRLALAIKTEGVVSAPLEGIAKVVIRDNKIGGEPYLSLYFAGPIRAAGGTVQAFAVLCAEHVRQKMGIAKWVATDDEVGRFVEEVKLYDRIMNLQYPSTNEELAFAVKHLTVELNGDPTEQREVSAHRNLPRIETNFVRGGPCLVLNDGVLLKSKKILRIIDKRKIPGWEWLLKLKKLAHADNKAKIEDDGKDKAKDYGGDTYKGKKQRDEEEISTSKQNSNQDLDEITPVIKRRQELAKKNPPLNKYIADIIAGRPVFAYPSQIGGHRIRYGRSRNTGLAACGTHPSQMILLDQFMAIGTQIRIERPGKSGSTMPVTSIEPPIVLMKDGEVKQLWDPREAAKIQKEHLAAKILFLGDMLFGYGEFVENNHIVLPSGYVEEWWAVELEENAKAKFDLLSTKAKKTGIKDVSATDFLKFIKDPFSKIPTGRQAVEFAAQYQVGIHPRYLDHWGNVNGTELLQIHEALRMSLINLLKENKNQPLSEISYDNLEKILENGLHIPNIPEVKNALEHAFVVHKVHPQGIWIDPNRAFIFYEIFGFGKSSNISEKDKYSKLSNIPKFTQLSRSLTALELFSHLTTLKVPDKAPYYMGSRMGRPEKAKERKMKPPVHSLFPIGHDSKLQRSFQNAIGAPKIEVDICQKICPQCHSITFFNLCPKCQVPTVLQKICPRCNKMYDISIAECQTCGSHLASTSTKTFSLKKYFEMAAAKIPKTIPTVKGVKGMSSEYKIPEPIEKGILRAINNVYVYKDGTIRADATDIPLTHFTCREIDTPVAKILELGYDVDIYGNPITDENQIIEIKVQDVLLTHHLGDYFVNVANFVDDELEYLYHQPRFYKVQTKYDLVGHYMVGLAPHTSAGIIGRLIGFTHAESGYAHPYWHAAKRRNCDGDEDGIMLLLECLLNFSLYYLPSSLGGKMDAPLVISLLLDPREVDGESHNVDYMARYPLQFYLDAQTYCKPKLKYMKLFADYLGTEAQFEGSMFTHPTQSINLGPRKSMYSVFETMEEKIDSQLYLAKTIQAVQVQDVARKVISSHFAPDILGNLRAFSTQGFRCPKCGSKYRRIPLIGRCAKCGNDLLMTVHPGGITKYLSKAQSFITDFALGDYTEQRWKLIERNVKDLTDNPRVKQKSIVSFFK